MANVTNTAAERAMNWLIDDGTPTRPEGPFEVALMTANGSASSAGTELTGGTYARQAITFASASGSGATSNSNLIQFDGLPSDETVGIEIYDDGGTRIFFGALTGSIVHGAGDSIQFQIGEIDVVLS